MENEPVSNKSRSVLLVFLVLILFIAFLCFLPYFKKTQLQKNLVKLEPPVAEKFIVKEELPVIPVVEEPAVVETQSQPVTIDQVQEPEKPIEAVPEKQIIERKIWQSNKGRLISNKEYVYFGKYIIVKEEIAQSNKNN